jgi:hypothetical protein
MNKMPVPSEETLLTEYAAAQSDYLHNDNFPWQIGSILIAGTFVFWGLLLDKQPNPQTLGTASLLISILLSVWILMLTIIDKHIFASYTDCGKLKIYSAWNHMPAGLRDLKAGRKYLIVHLAQVVM